MSHDDEDRALLDTMSRYLGRIHEMPEDDRLLMLGMLAGALSRRIDDAGELRSAEITLAAIRDTAESATVTAALPSAHLARGYQAAMRDVLAILDARRLAEGAPVILGGG